MREAVCVDCGKGFEVESKRGPVPGRCDVCHGRRRSAQRTSPRYGPTAKGYGKHVLNGFGPAFGFCKDCERPYIRWGNNGEPVRLCEDCSVERKLGYFKAHNRVTERDRLKRTSRARNLRRRSAGSISSSQAETLRSHARRCPLCAVTLIDEPARPASKEIDHIIPVNVGGSSDLWNLRVICRACNGRRPNDGSDLAQLPIGA